ncbi:DUF2267 domain-containing protein [Pseudonocardia phyllosphaerae]|uniref:DUF2267 domain-containing protein n=1 Tax=Pseudonocardia phyllosphaerae TaxID=3390502 RepID=UPI00397E3448
MTTANDPHPADSTRTLQAFVDQVRRAAGVGTESEAETLSRATFRQLGELISAGETQKLANSLPKELATELVATPSTSQARKVDRLTFVDAVTASTGDSDIETADARVDAVLGTLASWTPGSELDDLAQQLPDDLARSLRTS